MVKYFCFICDDYLLRMNLYCGCFKELMIVQAPGRGCKYTPIVPVNK